MPANWNEWLAAVRLRLRALAGRRRLDRDLADELEFHLAMREEQAMSDGGSRRDARDSARRRFGNVTALREQCRDLWTFAWFETLLTDLRYALRQLRRSPGFVAAATITLALGIGATTAVYSLLAAILWRPIPLPDVDSIVFLYQSARDQPMGFTFAPAGDIGDIGRATHTLDHVAMWANAHTSLVDSGGEAIVAESSRVSTNLFDMLRVQPALGRAFLPGEDQPGRDRVVILGHDLWQQHFGADPAIVGRTIRLDSANFTVVGVMPPEFRFPRSFRELWVPLVLAPEARNSHKDTGVEAAGRLKPGQTLAQAGAELNTIAARLEKQYPETNRNRRFLAMPFHRYWYGDLAAVFAGLMLGAAGFVLLIACVNVANLQFARAAARVREIALRVALGSGRTRLVRQFLAETMVLAVGGAVLGLLVARWALVIFKVGIPEEMRHYIPGWSGIGLNAQAFRFTAAAAIASGILAGLAPALHSLRVDLTESLKQGGHGASGGRLRSRWRGVLVAGEIGMATVLLVGSALMVHGFRSLVTGGNELRPASMLTMRLALSASKYPESFQVRRFYQDLLERAAAIPGVQSAVAATGLSYSRRYPSGRFEIEGRERTPGAEPSAIMESVTPDYFRTLFVGLRAGRYLSDGDGPAVAPVAVISASTARRWWRDEDPVGHTIQIGSRTGITIVGVVADIPYTVLGRDPSPAVYVPFAQAPDREMDIGLRTSGDPTQVAASVRAAVRSIDPELPITNLNTMDTLMRQEGFGLALLAGLMGFSGVLALVLSVVGVYGVMSYSISGRTHETGIRMALGARRSQVIGLLFRGGMGTALTGLVLGLIPAWGLARLMQSFIWGVRAADVVAFGGVPAVLLAASAIAIWVPSVRATRIDPVRILHDE